jgi:hypothetical protein
MSESFLIASRSNFIFHPLLMNKRAKTRSWNIGCIDHPTGHSTFSSKIHQVEGLLNFHFHTFKMFMNFVSKKKNVHELKPNHDLFSFHWWLGSRHWHQYCKPVTLAIIAFPKAFHHKGLNNFTWIPLYRFLKIYIVKLN